MFRVWCLLAVRPCPESVVRYGALRGFKMSLQFRLRSMLLLVPAIAITVAVVVQLNTLDLTKGRQSKCQVHKVLMSPAL